MKGPAGAAETAGLRLGYPDIYSGIKPAKIPAKEGGNKQGNSDNGGRGWLS